MMLALYHLPFCCLHFYLFIVCSGTSEGLVILVDLLHSNYRHLRFPQSKIVCLMLLVRLGRYCTDAVILQRALPLLLLALEDQCAIVR